MELSERTKRTTGGFSTDLLAGYMKNDSGRVITMASGQKFEIPVFVGRKMGDKSTPRRKDECMEWIESKFTAEQIGELKVGYTDIIAKGQLEAAKRKALTTPTK